MIKGVTVTVKTPSSNSVDRFGNAVYTFAESTVDNVLVSPGVTANLEAARPEGVSVNLTLHFPKSFTGSLEGCLIVLPEPWAGTYRVVGNPLSYIDANTPTQWHMPVEVVRADG